MEEKKYPDEVVERAKAEIRALEELGYEPSAIMSFAKAEKSWTVRQSFEWFVWEVAIGISER